MEDFSKLLALQIQREHFYLLVDKEDLKDVMSLIFTHPNVTMALNLNP